MTGVNNRTFEQSRSWIERIHALETVKWFADFDQPQVQWRVSADERRPLVRVLVWLERDDPDSELVTAIRQHLPDGAVIPEPTAPELAVASMVMRRFVDDPQLRAGLELGDGEELRIAYEWLGEIEEELEAAA